MRICVLTSSYPRFPGDIAGTFVASLAQALGGLGHDLRVVAPADPSVRPDGSHIPVARFRYSPLPFLQPMGYGKALENDQNLRAGAYLLAPSYFLSSALHLVRTLLRRRDDLLHVHWVLPNGPAGLVASKLAGVPMVVTLHGSDTYLAKRARVFGALARASFLGASAVTACSPDLAADACALGAAPGKLETIPWGADAARFAPAGGSAWRSRLRIRPEQPVVAALGRLVPKKGFDVLIQALALMDGGAVVLVGGDGPARRDLERRAAELGVAARVRFAGAVPSSQVPDFLAAADVVAVPSVRDVQGNVDGLPTVALEAMAAGKPVVASRIAGLGLAVEEGETGLLVPPGDPEGLAKALTSLIMDRRRAAALGAAGRARVQTGLSWEAIARRYEAVFRRVIEARGGRSASVPATRR